MTLQGSRSGIWLIAVLDVLVVVVAIGGALLVRLPTLVLMMVALVLLFGFVTYMVVRPVSLATEGADLVYRTGRSEIRIPLADVASAAFAGRGWVFRDISGGVPFSVNTMNFSNTDMIAFCNQTGIRLTGAIQKPVDQVSANLKSGKSMRLVAIIMLIFWLAFTVFAVVIFIQARQDLAAYQGSSVCESPTPSKGCRFEGQATITSVEAAKGYDIVHLALASGGTYNVDVHFEPPGANAAVEVEVWNGHVTMINGRRTDSHPALDPNLNPIYFLGLAFFIALTAGLAVYGQYQVATASRALRAAPA